MPDKDCAAADEARSDEPIIAKAVAAAAAAGTGAVMTTVMFYPVELVKNRLQSATRSGDGQGFAYTGLADGLSTILRDEGMRGLFTGLRPVVLRALASDFATVGFGEWLVALCRAAGGAVELPLRVVGGWGSIALTLPLETISTRVTCARPPLTASEAARQLLAEGGVGAFWRGLRVMLVLCLNPALTFTAFGWIRRLVMTLKRRHRVASIEERRQAAHSQSTADPPLQWWEAFLVGVGAKMATLVAVYPLIRAKFLMQAPGANMAVGIFGVIRRVWLDEGVRALYSGLDAQLSKSLLSSALMLAIKERTEERWHQFLLPSVSEPAVPSLPRSLSSREF